MAPSTINVLLSSFPGLSLPPTLAIPLPSTSSIIDLTDKISSYLPFPLTAQSSPLILTTTSNKQVHLSSPAKLTSLIPEIKDDEQNATSTFLPLRLSVRDANTGSNRNLDGRRLRTIKEAKALAEYLALKPEMDKKEKEARKRRWEAAVAAAEKKEQEIRNGEGKGKVDGAWMEDKEEMSEKARDAVLQAMKGGVWKDNLAGNLLGSSTPSASGSSDAWALPKTCHGCGALTQWVYPEEPGFYTVTRKPVKNYIQQIVKDQEPGGSVLVNPQPEKKPAQESKEAEIPLCDRCHNLINHGKGAPIPYPTLSYIRDLIDESPFQNNYIYHVLDAADFPLSVIPSLQRYMPIQPQRSQNRRSQAQKYGSNRRLAEINFIITRADLLSNVKPQADSLMQDMVQILRETLDRREHGIRLGNVHMVSSYRGWWTKEIKEDIWRQGGGVWMVGKVNVGKSKLITSVFPKTVPRYQRKVRSQGGVTVVGRSSVDEVAPQFEEAESDEAGAAVLLPPLRKEVPFPNLPIDSSRPGTTASPIRIPFDKHRGEVIDLPGLFRSGLDEFVQDNHKSDLVMTSRPRPTQVSIKPTQSLLLGGLIEIKPLEEREVVLAAPFLSLEAHVTSKDKAAEMITQQRQCPTGNIAKEGIGEQITSAGIVELKYDVTKKYAKPLASGELSPLYRVMGVDILIEGCGWVELTAQVRTKHRDPYDFPKVELFSPLGKFVGSRMPLCTYAFNLKHRAQKEQKRLAKSRRPPTKIRRPRR
ncbi:uncharacterized protein GIQ15_00102 [Arthroderma uncinatum]|uniref:uncharacterized protein n=1 Tax=Arthroderma uncinatum TaxID=74035 RepID=UPI00144A9591|nr:uncharacterized protein GIQ15_00102 [Arthroderma uncinatum]KAF3490585.1 hypothetical protein GIQ15_00102 [Arthroderma uncinatum]